MDPKNTCDYLTFPEMSFHLRRPDPEHAGARPAIIAAPWFRNLRLVCRTFRTFLGPSPYFVMKDASVSVPESATALYIEQGPNAQHCLPRLLTDSLICSRVVSLDLPNWEVSKRIVWKRFNDLCDVGPHALPALRSLSLGIRTSESPVFISKFWSRLGNAFPLLTCLVLRGVLDADSESEPVLTISKLEILECDRVCRSHSVQFPALRHAGFHLTSRFHLPTFEICRDLESLLLRSDLSGMRLEWSLLPNLKLVGLPQIYANDPLTFHPLPPGHPLQHVCVYVASGERSEVFSSYQAELQWLQETVERLPTLVQITFLFEKPSATRFPVMSAGFSDADLDPLGFSWHRLPDIAGGRKHVVLRRIRPPDDRHPAAPPHQLEPGATPEVESQGYGLHAGFKRFLRSAVLRFHP